MGGVWKMRECRPDFANNKFLKYAWIEYFKRQNSDIPTCVAIQGIPCFPHNEMGIFISKAATIGKNAVIFQHVTIGSNTIKGSKFGAPTIGDNCYIGAGAKIIGNVKIGNNCRIGANACVYTDMPDNSVAVCATTRVLSKTESLDNTFYSIEGGKYDFTTHKYLH